MEASAVADLDAQSWEALADRVAARPDERHWLEIPWETDIWTGMRQARRLGRPVFLWAMNGNPLGCV